MELTPGQKRQIEDEERQKFAEEQYREQVRARLLGAGSQAGAGTSEGRRSQLGPLLGILALVVVGIFILISYNRDRPNVSGTSNARAIRASSASSVRYVPVNHKIASGQVVVRANGYVQYRIQITPDMRDARISGSFNVSGGSGNDIAAVIASESEYTNWINGHQARVYYGTQGKKTTDSFDVRLGPGTYYFAISNKFSVFSDKHVFLEVGLNYSRMETY